MTIRDLAKLSGYSLGTVSRALNHQPNVSPKAREQILALAQQYGFEINANAQNLKKQKHRQTTPLPLTMFPSLMLALTKRL